MTINKQEAQRLTREGAGVSEDLVKECSQIIDQEIKAAASVGRESVGVDLPNRWKKWHFIPIRNKVLEYSIRMQLERMYLNRGFGASGQSEWNCFYVSWRQY